MERNKSPKRMGRPRSFDIDRALDRALMVFWRKGYEGASLSDLTKAVGVNRPSLYAAFGDKEALFRKALDRYLKGPAAYTQEALREPTARAVVERLLLRCGRFEHSPAQSRWVPHGARCACVWRGGRFHPAGTDRLPRGG